MEHVLNELLLDEREHLFESRGIDPQLPVIKPAIVIGLGGSGAKALARLKKRMQTWAESYATTYSRIQKTDGVPEKEIQDIVSNALRKAVSYLAIDTLSFHNLEQEDPVIAEALGTDDYLYAGGFNPVDYIARQYVGDENLQRWWENDFHPPYSYIDDGARRFRMLGRLALYRVREDFHSKLTAKVAGVVELRRQLVNLGLIHSTAEHLNEILIYLVTGSNGGTGSGMFFDAVFHAFAAVREAGDYLPKIRIVVVSPRIYLLKAAENGSGLHHALTANAYAFFQSLSLICERPRDAFKYVFDYNTNPVLQTLAKDFNEHWRPDKVYIVDTEIAGKEISDLDGMLTNAADYLYLDITQPVTIGGSEVVNLEQVLDGRSRGHRRILASFGISYFVLPSITIIKGLTTLLLHDLLWFIERGGHAGKLPAATTQKTGEEKGPGMLRDSSGRQLALQGGRELALAYVKEGLETDTPSPEKLGAWCREQSPEVLREFKQAVTKAAAATDVAGEIGSELHQIQDRKTACTGELKEFHSKLMKRYGMGAAVGLALLTVVAIVFATQTELMPVAVAALCGVILGGGAGMLSAHLASSGVRQDIQEIKSDIETESARERRFKKSVADVMKMVESTELTKIDDDVRTEAGTRKLAAELRESMVHYMANKLFALEPEEVTSGYTSIYTWGFRQDENGELKPVFGSPDRRMGEEMLQTIFVKADHIDTSLKIDYTSQACRAHPLFEEVRAVLREVKTDDGKLTRDSRDAVYRKLVKATSRAIVENYKTTLGLRGKDDMDLWQGLDSMKDVTAGMRGYFREVGEQMRTLSDPTWAYDREDAPDTKRINARHLVPVNSQDGFKPVWDEGAKERVKGVLYDKRLAITVQSEYGVPIFALRGMREWKRKYEIWLAEWRARSEAPPHVDKRWLTENGESVLPVLEANDDEKITEAYVRLLLMGAYLKPEAKHKRHNGLDFKTLRSTRGETFEVFYNKIVDQWSEESENDGGVGVLTARPPYAGGIATDVKVQTLSSEERATADAEKARTIYEIMRANFEEFRRLVHQDHWELGEIASYWDKVKEDEKPEFDIFQKNKKIALRRLYDFIKGIHIPTEDELRRIVDELDEVFKVTIPVPVPHKEDDQAFLSYLALALARL